MKSIEQQRHPCKHSGASPAATMVPVTVHLPGALHSALRAEGLLDADVVRGILSAALEQQTAGSRNAAARPPHEPEALPWLAQVTPAEWRVLDLLATHLTLAGIADRLFVSRATVKSHVASLYQKLDVSRRADAVAALHAATGYRAALGGDAPAPRPRPTSGSVTEHWQARPAAQRLAG